MQQTVQTIIPDLIEQHYQRLLDRWLAAQKRMGSAGGQIAEDRLADQSRLFLTEVRKGVAAGHFDDISGPEWDSTRDVLDRLAGERAVPGFSPPETAVFVFSLKEPLFELLREEITDVEMLSARDLGGIAVDRQARDAHHRGLPEGPRRCDPPATGGTV